jgi:RNA polymerase sigma factor (sigma-70 family)
VKLAAQYDPKRGVPFKAFAQRRIYGACIDSVRRKEYLERAHQTIEGVEHVCTMLSPEQQAAAAEQRRVWIQVQQLPPRHALVILAVYGGGMTLEELARKVDVGSSRLSQIHHEALHMLRETCGEMKAAA